MKIALEYYYPERDYSFEELDLMTGRTSEKWTWTSQAMELLVNEGLDAYYYSTTPYDKILDGGEEFILDYYGEDDGEIIIAHTDFDSLYKSIETLNNYGRYFDQKLEFENLEEEFNEGSLLLFLIDRSELISSDLSYAGHFVTITGINETHVVFHDTRGTPNKIVEREVFLRAWNAPGTDNDVIVVKGKI